MSHLFRARPNSRTRRAFTLIELLVVVVIMGIMALIVLPKVRIDNSAVDTAARTISMALMVAQRDAVARQHSVIVEFDTAAHTARTVWDANNNRIADNGEKTRPFLIPEAVVMGRPAGVTALGTSADISVSGTGTARGPTIILQRSGSADRAAVIYLTSYRAKNGGQFKDARAIVIARATGRPTWYAWTGTKWRRGI